MVNIHPFLCFWPADFLLKPRFFWKSVLSKLRPCLPKPNHHKIWSNLSCLWHQSSTKGGSQARVCCVLNPEEAKAHYRARRRRQQCHSPAGTGWAAASHTFHTRPEKTQLVSQSTPKAHSKVPGAQYTSAVWASGELYVPNYDYRFQGEWQLQLQKKLGLQWYVFLNNS